MNEKSPSHLKWKVEFEYLNLILGAGLKILLIGLIITFMVRSYYG